MNQGEIRYADLSPTVGSELKESRPCLIISPDAVNSILKTVVIAPITSTIKSYPYRIGIKVNRIRGDGIIQGQIAPDQLRVLDKVRLSNAKAILPVDNLKEVLSILRDMFADIS